MNRNPDLTMPDWSERHRLDGDIMAVLFYSDGRAAFRHRCDRGDRGTVVCAPFLAPEHRIALRYPLTITPSILCPDCGIHGWVTDGTWRPA